MNNKFDDYEISESKFNELSIIEKRNYIIQTEQHNTMWYQRQVSRIQFISYILIITFSILYFLTNVITKIHFDIINGITFK